MKNSNSLSLDSNFFENLFELENNFYNDPNENAINEIIDNYNKAIEYYKSVNDKRNKLYLNRLKVFVSRPVVAAVLNKSINKKSKDISKDVSKVQSDGIINYSIESQDKVNQLIENDITKQEEQYKSKLFKTKSSSISDNFLSTSPSPKNSFELDDNNNHSPLKIQLVDTLLDNNKMIGKNQKHIIENITKLLENFIPKFNSSFCTGILKKYAYQILSLFNEKYEKYTEAEKQYNDQINEVESELLEQYEKKEKEQDTGRIEMLKVVQDSLEEERQNELDNIEDVYNEKIKSLINHLNQITVYEKNSALLLEEEKLKAEFVKLLIKLISI